MYGNAGFFNKRQRDGMKNETQLIMMQSMESESERLYRIVAQRALNLISQIEGQASDKKDGGFPKCILDQINAQTDANHVYITISGFFSENIDKMEHWKGVARHFEFGQKEIFDSNASIFSLTWESKTNNDLYKEI